jgi:hypothetical protein
VLRRCAPGRGFEQGPTASTSPREHYRVLSEAHHTGNPVLTPERSDRPNIMPRRCAMKILVCSLMLSCYVASSAAAGDSQQMLRDRLLFCGQFEIQGLDAMLIQNSRQYWSGISNRFREAAGLTRHIRSVFAPEFRVRSRLELAGDPGTNCLTSAAPARRGPQAQLLSAAKGLSRASNACYDANAIGLQLGVKFLFSSHRSIRAAADSVKPCSPTCVRGALC